MGPPADGAAEASPAADLGTLGSYRLLSELGHGGQGIVYLALDARLQRKVALKVLYVAGPPSIVSSSRSSAAARLRREAELASKLDHPGICAVHEIGVAEGALFVAMRYIEGRTLAQLIAQARDHLLPQVEIGAPAAGEPAESRDTSESSTGTGTARRRSVMRVVAFVEQAARALHAAHESGIIHRDIKPANRSEEHTSE